MTTQTPGEAIVTAEAVDAAIAKFYEGYPCEIAKSYVHFKPMRDAILATGLPQRVRELEHLLSDAINASAAAQTCMVKAEANLAALEARVSSISQKLEESENRRQEAERYVLPQYGDEVAADHPITFLNPSPTFIVAEIEYFGDSLSVRGEDTCWFGARSVRLVKRAALARNQSHEG